MPDGGSSVLSLPVFVVNVDNSYINKSLRLTLYGKMKNNKPAPLDLLQTAGWTVSDPTICRVENGLVVPLKNGECIVTANIDGITASVTIRIGDVTIERLYVGRTNVIIPLGGVIELGSEVSEIFISVPSTTIDLGGIISINQ